MEQHPSKPVPSSFKQPKKDAYDREASGSMDYLGTSRCIRGASAKLAPGTGAASCPGDARARLVMRLVWLGGVPYTAVGQNQWDPILG